MAKGYGHFCPVAMAAEIVGPRWNLSLLSEMMAGSVRFNEIRRGVPRMSPTLLSKRLKELQDWGLVERREGKGGAIEYHLTPPAEELRPIIHALGCWSHGWVKTSVTLQNLDAQMLMWHVRRSLVPSPPPRRRTVVQFIYPELPKKERNFWLVLMPDEDVDLCSIDPGFDVDLFVSADLLAMTKAYMGHSTFAAEAGAGRITFTGDPRLRANLTKWLGQSSFAAAAPRGKEPRTGRVQSIARHASI